MFSACFLHTSTIAKLMNNLTLKHPTFLHKHHHCRTFIAARIKWYRDPYLDDVVSREKNLLHCLSLKNLLLSFPSPPPLSLVALHYRPPLILPSSPPPNFFIQKYPSLFTHSPFPPHHVSLTPAFLSLHLDELSIHHCPSHRHVTASRLAKLLMLTKAWRVPLCIIDDLKFDLGLPDNYMLDLVSYYPDYFRVCKMECNGKLEVGLELVKWQDDFAVPAVLKDQYEGELGVSRRGREVRFRLLYPPGFELQKRVKDWVEEWQCLPYISPYEDAFHLGARSDVAEKWTVGVLHEILSLLISKKTEMKNVLRLGEYLGFGVRFKKALVHYPGMFYYSNKLRTATVVLREAFRKDFLMEKHLLMGMRHRYIYLMSKSRKGRKFLRRVSLRDGPLITRSEKGIESSQGKAEKVKEMDTVFD